MTWLDEPELQPAPEHIAAAGRAAIAYASPLVRAVMIASQHLKADLKDHPEEGGMTQAELEDQGEALEMIIQALLGRPRNDSEPLSDDEWNRGIDWLMAQHGDVH
jgi:hypothetical protein